MKSLIVIALFIFLVPSEVANAQTSSLGARKREAQAGQPEAKPIREKPVRERNLVYEKYAWTATKARPPKVYRPQDLITIIVRHTRRFKAEADLETKKEWDLSSEISAFIKGTAGGLGSADFRRGRPNIDYKFQNELSSDGDTQRRDSLTTRVTARVIDVKPNGELVLQARAVMQHDDELSTITVTGICRKEDITAANTILSTQIADLDIRVQNEGALRASSSRGWIPRLIDMLKPF